MRILHTADLHIGKILHRKSLLNDQKIILPLILKTAKEQQADALLITGDLYQRADPSPEAMTVLSDFLTEAVRAGLPCYIISGNHDSAERIRYLAQIAEKSGIHIADTAPGTVQTFTVTDEFGPLHLHLMPYCTPVSVRQQYPDEADSIRTYEDAVRTVLAHHPVSTAERNLLAAHQFLTGAAVSDSEELAVGGLDNISAALFDDFDYVALGHLHGPQSVSRETVRYAGSPLRYSFSEVHQNKSVTLVDIREKGTVSYEVIPLAQPHGMQVLTGGFDTLMQAPHSEDYVQISLTDECPPPDASRALRTVFPNLLQLTVKNSKSDAEGDETQRYLPDQTDFMEILSGFFASQYQGASLTDTQTEIVRQILEKMDKEGDAS